MKKIIAIIGARPQFIKHFPFEKEAKTVFDLLTIHTGQHYDHNMSQVFFDELGMRKPNYILKVGSNSHAKQTAQMMVEIEEILQKEVPDAIVVYGDTNSTLAGALVASKMHIPIIHIEAGLRSFNMKMPEEVNRILTDHVSDLLLVPSDVATQNLKVEGIKENVHTVGDIMKDLILLSLKENWISPIEIDEPYYYSTLHRPYNTDEKDRLESILNIMDKLDKKVVFSIHPRTVNAMEKYKLEKTTFSNIHFIKPQGYFDNLSYLFHSSALITDSGGMQKEAYWLKKRCITIRSETEWKETLKNNWNHLLFENLDAIPEILQIKLGTHDENLYGKGDAASLIVESIESRLASYAIND